MGRWLNKIRLWRNNYMSETSTSSMRAPIMIETAKQPGYMAYSISAEHNIDKQIGLGQTSIF